MCGLFGFIGKGANPSIIRALTIANRERGAHSVGYFKSDSESLKIAADPLSALGMPEFSAFFKAPAWFIAGHTRHATQGAKITQNAHPFRYGRFVGSHNGMVDAPREYTVDSEYLIDALNRNDGDYQKALENVSGYWGLTWFDGESFYMQAHENSIFIAKADDGAFYYSSDARHLRGAIGACEPVEVTDGVTLRFREDASEPEALTALVNRSASWGMGFRAATNGVATGAKTIIVPSKRQRRRGRKIWASLPPASVRDEMAHDLGYFDFAEFMSREGHTNKAHAVSALERELEKYAKEEGIDHFDTFAFR